MYTGVVFCSNEINLFTLSPTNKMLREYVVKRKDLCSVLIGAVYQNLQIPVI